MNIGCRYAVHLANPLYSQHTLSSTLHYYIITLGVRRGVTLTGVYSGVTHTLFMISRQPLGAASFGDGGAPHFRVTPCTVKYTSTPAPLISVCRD